MLQAKAYWLDASVIKSMEARRFEMITTITFPDCLSPPGEMISAKGWVLSAESWNRFNSRVYAFQRGIDGNNKMAWKIPWLNARNEIQAKSGTINHYPWRCRPGIRNSVIYQETQGASMRNNDSVFMKKKKSTYHMLSSLLAMVPTKLIGRVSH